MCLMKQILIWLCHIMLSIDIGIKLSHHNISDAQEHEKPGQHCFCKICKKAVLAKGGNRKLVLPLEKKNTLSSTTKAHEEEIQRYSVVNHLSIT